MGSLSRVIVPLIWVISIVTLLITPPITTHEPPSRDTVAHKVSLLAANMAQGFGFEGLASTLYETTADPKS